nr:UDP-glycosyltransferase 91D2-like [Lolium perenne]
MRWLDAQPAKSVVYVALGSEAPMRAELLRELAHGLELAGTRFLWALRRPVGFRGGDSLLPDDFVERTGERGLVAARWVPQMSILAHGAVGAFLTHCGWGSVLEGLQFGHPLIMLPIAGDQGPNARLMEERKVGVLVPRNDEDGSFSRDNVVGAVRAVVDSRVFAASAKKLQEIVANRQCHERYIDGFIQHLRTCSLPAPLMAASLQVTTENCSLISPPPQLLSLQAISPMSPQDLAVNDFAPADWDNMLLQPPLPAASAVCAWPGCNHSGSNENSPWQSNNKSWPPRSIHLNQA